MRGNPKKNTILERFGGEKGAEKPVPSFTVGNGTVVIHQDPLDADAFETANYTKPAYDFEKIHEQHKRRKAEERAAQAEREKKELEEKKLALEEELRAATAAKEQLEKEREEREVNEAKRMSYVSNKLRPGASVTVQKPTTIPKKGKAIASPHKNIVRDLIRSRKDLAEKQESVHNRIQEIMGVSRLQDTVKKAPHINTDPVGWLNLTPHAVNEKLGRRIEHASLDEGRELLNEHAEETRNKMVQMMGLRGNVIPLRPRVAQGEKRVETGHTISLIRNIFPHAHSAAIAATLARNAREIIYDDTTPNLHIEGLHDTNIREKLSALIKNNLENQGLSLEAIEQHETLGQLLARLA
jgi:phage terminase Nu1 subunit (DNA packaging protein)